VTANLLVNAAYAVPEKQKGRVSITTRYLKRLGAVTMEIEDNGTGMTSEVIEQIFEPFFTTRRDKGGTGLGLSVSYRLIKEHGGIIGVLSKPGLGSRFTVFLPLVEGTTLQLRPTALCMDDDRSFLNKLKSDLGEIKTMSFETRIKPKRIMNYLEEHPDVDILLLKIMIPEEDGWALYRKIKSKFPLLTVVLYLNKKTSRIDKTGSIVGADHLLQTPFSTEQLLEIINSTQRQRL
jgi:CheY-like chemotaxis protein